jgi:CubicO group peptidase (beta-lactamase class C family)
VPGLSVGVVSGESVCWQHGFGRADLSSGAPARPGTPYLWFSMTKIVTATAVMRLADEGRLDLDARGCHAMDRIFPDEGDAA